LTTANGVLKGLAESKSDGIIQVSTGGAAGGYLCDRHEKSKEKAYEEGYKEGQKKSQ
jgi:hypothetical protein